MERMGDVFFKSLRWFLFIGFMIGGIAAIEQTEVHGIKPLMPAILSFGMAYIMSGPWRKLPRVPMITSILVVAALALAAQYLPGFLYVYLAIRLAWNFYFIWLGLVFVIGMPFMMFIFSKHDD